MVLKISILLPEADTTTLKDVIKNSDYYSTETFKLEDILTRSFIDGFLKAGKFSCVPTDHSISQETFLIHKNKLIIRLHKDSLFSANAVELCHFKTKSSDENEISSKLNNEIIYIKVS